MMIIKSPRARRICMYLMRAFLICALCATFVGYTSYAMWLTGAWASDQFILSFAVLACCVIVYSWVFHASEARLVTTNKSMSESIWHICGVEFIEDPEVVDFMDKWIDGNASPDVTLQWTKLVSSKKQITSKDIARILNIYQKSITNCHKSLIVPYSLPTERESLDHFDWLLSGIRPEYEATVSMQELRTALDAEGVLPEKKLPDKPKRKM